jgi:hypothetical protein
MLFDMRIETSSKLSCEALNHSPAKGRRKKPPKSNPRLSSFSYLANLVLSLEAPVYSRHQRLRCVADAAF